MPAVSISPILNASQQFTAGGLPLVGGLINTYQAGTTTPVLSYTDSAGTIANSNPIVLDSAGRPPSLIWLINGTAYKFVVTDSLGADSRTFDNIIGIGTTTGNGTFADLTVTGNTLLGDASTDTLNVGNGGIIKDNAGYVGLGVAPTAGQGQLQILGSANGGIKLGNQNNTYANALDWYEEGVWTPALKMGGLFGVTTYTAASGTYTRIGNIVLFNGTIQINVYDASTGGITFSATAPIPYASLAGTFPVNVSAQGLTLTSPGWLAAGLVGGSGAPDVTLRINSVAGSVSAVAGTNVTLANGCSISVEGYYRVA